MSVSNSVPVITNFIYKEFARISGNEKYSKSLPMETGACRTVSILYKRLPKLIINKPLKFRFYKEVI